MIVGSDGLQGETDRGNCLGLWVFGCVACSAHSLLGCRVLSEMDPYIWLEKMVTLKGKWVNKTESQGVEAEATVEVPAHSLSLKTVKKKLGELIHRKGSVSDIGWVMNIDGDPVQDETELFYSIWDTLKIEPFGSGNVPLLGFSYLLVPGLFTNSYPTYFREILAYFKDVLCLQCEFANINTEGSVKSNAAVIRDIVLSQYEQFGKKVVLLGHSKGGTDAAAACAMYWPELKDKVRGLLMLQAPYGGTPLAADLLSEGQFGVLNSLLLGKLASFSNPNGTVDAVRDLTYKNRRDFLKEYPMPRDVPILCLHSNFPPDSKARFKKYMLKENFLNGRLEVPLEMQLGKQMAYMSKYILSRYPGAESDGLVTRKDAVVPGSVVVEFKEDLGHTLVIPEVIHDSQNSEEVPPPPLNASLVCHACVMVLLSTR